jgi:hypothetical protein
MERRIDCRWEGATVTLGMEEAGSGSSVVLLPALSSISTRAEMRPLFDRLKSDFHVAPSTGPASATCRGRAEVGHLTHFPHFSIGS